MLELTVTDGYPVHVILCTRQQRDMESLENAAKKWSTDNPGANGAGQLIPVHVDISSKESIEKLYKEISQKEDQLHLLVNNVSMSNCWLEVLRLSSFRFVYVYRPVFQDQLVKLRKLQNQQKLLVKN